MSPSRNTIKPNFIIIGAARSGTTSLFKYLESHPDIFMSEIKEINFFSNEKYWKLGFDWYCEHFSGATQFRIGEASTSYTCFPHLSNVPERIHSFLPGLKMIYVVRDPIDRLISHYIHRVIRGLESRELSDIVSNYRDDFLLAQGRYFLQIQQYLEFFPMQDIYCFSIDNLKNNPIQTVKSIYEFLGVEASVATSQNYKVHNANKRLTKKNAFGMSILHFYHEHIEQRPLPYTIKKLFLNFAELGATSFKPSSLDGSSLEILTDYYREDVLDFSRLVGLDISQWRSYSR